MGFILDILKDIPLSSVLRERIVQFETEVSVLNGKLDACTAELAHAKATIRKLKSESLNLKKKIYKLEAKKQALSNFERHILDIFKEYSQITIKVISEHLSIDPLKAEYYADELVKKGFLSVHTKKNLHSSSYEAHYLPTHKGKEYLIENNIV